jgi:hypothetical protein
MEKRRARTKLKPASSEPAKNTRIKPAKRGESSTAYSIFLKTLEDSKNGITKAQLKVKTGFSDKKIANLVYKAKKRGKIMTLSRDVYTMV